MKKLIAMLGAASMVLTCFVSCGEKSADELNDISNYLYKSGNSSLTELDEEGIDTGGRYWFDSDRNISDTARENLVNNTDDLYSKVSTFYKDADSYKWVMYCESGAVKEVYTAESFDGEVVGSYPSGEYTVIDLEGKTLNDIKQEIDIRDKVTLDQFEERLSALINADCEEIGDTDGSLADFFKLSEREISEKSENSFIYRYGGYDLVVNTDEKGYIYQVISMANGYMFNDEYSSNLKTDFLMLHLLTYSAMWDSDIVEVADFSKKLLKNEQVNEKNIRYSWSDEKYEYSLLTSSLLTMFTIELKD